MPQTPYDCEAEHAFKFWSWLQTREGIARWKSVDLSDITASWTTPVIDADGKRLSKPHWKCDSQPARIVTDPAEVVVHTSKEVRRFRVGLKRGSGFMQMVCTDASTRKIREAVKKASQECYAERCKTEGAKPENEDLAFYVFDYETQEAVIMVPTSSVPLTEYILANLGDF